MKRLLFLFTFIVLPILFLTCEKPDEEAPTVTILTLQENDIVSGIVTITCIATDNEAVEKVELWLDGEYSGISDKNEPYKLEWNTTEYENGSYVVTVRVYDVNGNKSDSNPINVTLYNNLNEPVAYFIVSPASGTTTTTFTFDASGSSDNEDETAVLEVRWDWENDGTWDTDYRTIKTITQKFPEPGTYKIVLEVLDTGDLVNTITKTIDVYKAGLGAIVLTFDDKHIGDWYKADSIFSIYDWKATFCVTAYGTLTENEKLKLMTLQNNGHEIAHHGYKHYNAIEYLSNHSMQDYLNAEILPSIDAMENDGFNITSFVYPGGVRTVELDLALFDYFSVLRGTTYGRIAVNNQNCFLVGGRDELLVYGLGIDNHYEHFDIEYILRLIEYAANEDIAVIFYGHKIADDDISSYVTSFDTLNKICKYAQEKGMEFLTLRELSNLNLN